MNEDDKFTAPLPGLAGMLPLDYGEALIEMSFALHDHEAGLDESLMIAEEVLHKLNLNIERGGGKGDSARNATKMQMAAWGWHAVAVLPSFNKAA